VASLKQDLSGTSGKEEASGLDDWDLAEAPPVLQFPSAPGAAPVSNPPLPKPTMTASPPALGGGTLMGLTPVPHEPAQAGPVVPPGDGFQAGISSIPPGGSSSLALGLSSGVQPSADASASTRPSEVRTPVPRGVLMPGEQFGVYHVGPCIGEGGMARIYQAEHSGLRRQVALKVLLDASTRAPEGRERFLREARIAAAIKHPNVVNIFDVGVHEDTAFLVMELLTGTDLERLIEERGALDEGTIIDIMVPVLAGLTAVHDAGVVHRDLKPGNVFLAQGRYDEVDPKLLDFGISKAPGREQLRLTGSGMLIGTPFYMSPEGLRGEEMTPASDQYSLGVVMYECATGTNPFHATTFAEIFRLIGAGNFAPPSAAKPQLTKRLERIIMRAMSLDPAHRFKDLREMGRELLALAGQRTRITWSLSFGEIERGKGSSTPTWTVPERSVTPAPLDEEVFLLRPRRRLMMPILWSGLGAALVFLALASAGVFSNEARPESKQPEARAAPLAAGVAARTTEATGEPARPSVAASETAAAAQVTGTGSSVHATAAALAPPPSPPTGANSAPAARSPHRAASAARHALSTQAAAVGSKSDDGSNPDWAIAPAPAQPKPTAQPRAQVGVGANGAPIFD